jgi:hypothetical protein
MDEHLHGKRWGIIVIGRVQPKPETERQASTVPLLFLVKPQQKLYTITIHPWIRTDRE